MNSVFEVIGPSMIGPSSSHTAGAVRIGLVARQLLGGVPCHVDIGLHGSFAATGKGHATDRGIVAGLLGYMPDDERLKDALVLAQRCELKVEIHEVDLGEDVHPNSAQIKLTDARGESVMVVCSSIGGGSIEVGRLDEFPVLFNGTLDALVIWHADRPGFLAKVTAVLGCVESNIATIRTARRHRGEAALTVIEMDAPLIEEGLGFLGKIPAIGKVRTVDRFN